MPEGDTIHYAARRIRAVLQGQVPHAIETPQRRHGADRWPQRLAGRAVQRVDAHGKHLFLRFEGELVLHSHLRMTGSWDVYSERQRWRRAPRRAWLVLRSAGHAVVQFDGPVLELMSESRSRFDLRLARLGQDILGEDFDEQLALAALRECEPTRGIGDALLDQQIVAGIGNVWKAETCFAARLDPWRAAGEVPDEQLLLALRFARERMAASARAGFAERPREVYRRSGEDCRRCGGRVRSRGQGDENRITYWCAGCQV
ncbi:MAG: DNA-formamidopyrimidine glycosylase family protein [Solirubrobacteraceae bacterium]